MILQNPFPAKPGLKARLTPMSDAPNPSPTPPGGQAAFNPDAAHHQKPRLRPVRGFMTQHQGRPMLGLADAQQVSEKMVFTAPAVQSVLGKLDGQHGIDQIIEEVGRGLTRPMLESVVAQLDDAGLLEGPTFEAMYDKLKDQFQSAPHLPPGSTAAIADRLVMMEHGQEATQEQKDSEGPEKLAAQFDSWIDQALKSASDPSFDRLPKAVMVPSIDYLMGWPNYAAVYGRMRVVDPPKRIVVLGTHQGGFSTGVCGCDKGYETPLGVSPLAQDFFDAITSELGEENTSKLLAHRYDHERAHAIELQVAWIQHVFGAESSIPVMGFIVHDPLVKGGESYDGEGLGLDPFISALQGAIGKLDGETLIVAAADLAHVGPQFGDQQSLVGDDESAKTFREEVMNHDRQMVGLIAQGKHSELVSAIQWQQNRMRWTGLGPIVAAMRVCGEPEARVLNYFAAADPKGQALVSSFAAAIG